MKSILIINVPEDFDYRRCSMGGDGNIYYERKCEQRTSIIGNIKNLKPTPQKEPQYMKEECYLMGFIDGYNRCIEEILGG